MNYHYKLNCYEEFYCYVYGVLRMGAFILSCTGVIGDSSEIMAFAPLLAIPQLVRFYGGWEKKRKKGSLLLQLAWGGLLAGGGLLCLLPFSLWSGKETIWAQALLAGCAAWVAVFCF